MAEADWSEGEDHVSIDHRVELLGITVGVGDHVVLRDPEHETEDRPAGVEELGTTVIMDLSGHLHLPGEPCIPLSAPFKMSPEVLNDLISGLEEVREQVKRHDAARSQR